MPTTTTSSTENSRPFSLMMSSTNQPSSGLTLNDLYSANGSFKTGMTPRSGLTPRTGFTPRIGSGLTPKHSSGFGGYFLRSGFTPKHSGGNHAEPLPMPSANDSKPEDNMPPLLYEYLQNGGHGATESFRQDDMKKQESDARRRLKNRERVRKCRKRKNDRLDYLESRNTELEHENEALRSKLGRIGIAQDVGEAAIQGEAARATMIQSQRATLERLKNAINTGSSNAIVQTGSSIWLNHATLIHGTNGKKIHGMDQILNDYDTALNHVFSSYRVRNVSYTSNNDDTLTKGTAVWELDVSVKADAAPGVAPFSQLAQYFDGDRVRVKVTSYLTFKGDKIAQEIRLIDTFQLVASILEKNTHLGRSEMKEITQMINA